MGGEEATDGDGDGDGDGPPWLGRFWPLLWQISCQKCGEAI